MIKGLVTYDLQITRERTRLSKFLSIYGQRVQLSVFEFELEQKEYKEMLKGIVEFNKEYIITALSKGIKDELRSIRIYIFCNTCYGKMKKYEEEDRDLKQSIIIV